MLKSDSPAAVQQLHQLGLDVIMLTGDNEATAQTSLRPRPGSVMSSPMSPTADCGDPSGGARVVMVGDGIGAGTDVGMAIESGTDVVSPDPAVFRMWLWQSPSAGPPSETSGRTSSGPSLQRSGHPCGAWCVLFPAFGIQLGPMLGAAAMSLSSVS